MPAHHRERSFGLLAFAAVLSLPFGSAIGESAPVGMIDASAWAPIVADLDAPDFQTRENASEKIRSDAAMGMDQIGALLSQADLSIEQRRRLLQLFQDRFSATPRSAIGISFGVCTTDPRGIMITSVKPGFPAAAAGAIQLGDILVSLAGISLVPDAAEIAEHRRFAGAAGTIMNTREQLAVPGIIQSFDPGDSIPAEILRLSGPHPEIKEIINGGDMKTDPQWPREKIRVMIPLGKFDDLPQQPGFGRQQVVPAALETAVKLRLSRLGVHLPEPTVVSTGVMPTDPELRLPNRPAPCEEVRMVGSNRNPGLGTSYALTLPSVESRAAMRAQQIQQQNIMRMVVRNGQRQLLAARKVDANAPVQAGAKPVTSEEARADEALEAPLRQRVLRQMAQLDAELRAHEAGLAGRALDPAERTAAETRSAQLREQIESLRDSLTRPDIRTAPRWTREAEVQQER